MIPRPRTDVGKHCSLNNHFTYAPPVWFTPPFYSHHSKSTTTTTSSSSSTTTSSSSSRQVPDHHHLWTSLPPSSISGSVESAVWDFDRSCLFGVVVPSGEPSPPSLSQAPTQTEFHRSATHPASRRLLIPHTLFVCYWAEAEVTWPLHLRFCTSALPSPVYRPESKIYLISPTSLPRYLVTSLPFLPLSRYLITYLPLHLLITLPTGPSTFFFFLFTSSASRVSPHTACYFCVCACFLPRALDANTLEPPSFRSRS